MGLGLVVGLAALWFDGYELPFGTASARRTLGSLITVLSKETASSARCTLRIGRYPWRRVISAISA